MPGSEEKRDAPPIGRPTAPRPNQKRVNPHATLQKAIVVFGLLAGLMLSSTEVPFWTRTLDFAPALQVEGLTPVRNDPTAWSAVAALLPIAGGACVPDGERYTHVVGGNALGSFMREAERLRYDLTILAASHFEGPWPPLNLDGHTPSPAWTLWRARAARGATYYALWEGGEHQTVYSCEGPVYRAPASRHNASDVRTLCRHAVSRQMLIFEDPRWTHTPEPEWNAASRQWSHVVQVENENILGEMVPSVWTCTIPEGRQPVVMRY